MVARIASDTASRTRLTSRRPRASAPLFTQPSPLADDAPASIVFLSDDFPFEDTTGEIGAWAKTEIWCVAGDIRISNFNTIRENDHYIVATHDVEQDGKPHSNVMVYAEQTNGKFTYWKIQRAFEV